MAVLIPQAANLTAHNFVHDLLEAYVHSNST